MLPKEFDAVVVMGN